MNQLSGWNITSCRVLRSRSRRVFTAVQSCCISLNGSASSPGKGSSSRDRQRDIGRCSLEGTKENNFCEQETVWDLGSRYQKFHRKWISKIYWQMNEHSIQFNGILCNNHINFNPGLHWLWFKLEWNVNNLIFVYCLHCADFRANEQINHSCREWDQIKLD